MYTIDVNQEYESRQQQKLPVVLMYRSCLVSNILIIIYIFVIKNKYTHFSFATENYCFLPIISCDIDHNKLSISSSIDTYIAVNCSCILAFLQSLGT